MKGFPAQPVAASLPVFALIAFPRIEVSHADLLAAAQRVESIVSQYPIEIKTLLVLKPSTLAALKAHPTDATVIGQAVTEISTGLNVSSGQALADVLALSRVPQGDVDYLNRWEPIVAKAAQDGQLPGN